MELTQIKYLLQRQHMAWQKRHRFRRHPKSNTEHRNRSPRTMPARLFLGPMIRRIFDKLHNKIFLKLCRISAQNSRKVLYYKGFRMFVQFVYVFAKLIFSEKIRTNKARKTPQNRIVESLYIIIYTIHAILKRPTLGVCGGAPGAARLSPPSI